MARSIQKVHGENLCINAFAVCCLALSPSAWAESGSARITKLAFDSPHVVIKDGKIDAERLEGMSSLRLSRGKIYGNLSLEARFSCEVSGGRDGNTEAPYLRILSSSGSELARNNSGFRRIAGDNRARLYGFNGNVPLATERDLVAQCSRSGNSGKPQVVLTQVALRARCDVKLGDDHASIGHGNIPVYVYCGKGPERLPSSGSSGSGGGSGGVDDFSRYFH